MEIEKLIKIKCDTEFEGLTLLSRGEYWRYIENIPNVNLWWWLRSPGSSASSAAGVDCNGALDYGDVYYNHGAVRPALIITSNLQVGDRFKFFEHNWTVISNEYALCDEKFCRMAFRKERRVEDVNVYEASDIKKYLDAEWEKMRDGEKNG